MTAKPTQGVLDLCFIEVKTSEDIANYLVEIEKEREKKLEMEAQHRLLESENNGGIDGNNMTGTHEGGGELIPTSPKTRKKNEKESYKAIRIGNNHIDNIDTIFCLSNHVNFDNILWIDLSFNLLTKVGF